MTIGRNIRSLRERYGLTQCELAERAGVTQVYISYCENGRKAVAEVLQEACGGLRLSCQ